MRPRWKERDEAWALARARALVARELADSLIDPARSSVQRGWLAHWAVFGHRLPPGGMHILPDVTVIRVSRLTGRASNATTM
jgi:hypothetical protein